MFHWNVDPIIVSFGFVQIRWYSLMFLLGFSMGYKIMEKICQEEGKSPEKLDSLLVHVVLGTTIGARLGHTLLYEPGYYLTHPLEIFKIWEGGLASHGGVLGVIIAIALFKRKNPEFGLFWLWDRLSIPTIMACGFIRIGNLFNSEILGKPTDGSWGIIFDRVDTYPRHPSMIYESICYLLVSFLAFKIYQKRKSATPAGLIFGFVLAVAFIARFCLEFFKENQESFEANLFFNMGQLLSLPFILIGAWLMWRAQKSLGSFDPSRK